MMNTILNLTENCLANGVHLTAINQLQGRVENLTPVFEEIGNLIAQNITLELGAGNNAWGSPFEPLKKPRKSNHGFGNDVPLNDTRQHIYNKITFKTDSDGVDIGILEDITIGKFHQFGTSKMVVRSYPFMAVEMSICLAIGTRKSWQ